MTTNTNAVLAQLRHLYANMMGGEVRDTAQTKRMAQGLLAPAIEALEQAALTTAAAVPLEGWVHVPVYALKRWRAAFAEELAAYDIDPPIHHVKASHDEIAQLLAAAPKEEPVPAGEYPPLPASYVGGTLLSAEPGITGCKVVLRFSNTDEAEVWFGALATRRAAPVAQGDAEDAARYRFLAGHCRSTSEHWGGRWSIIVDGPAPKSHDSEDDFDEAVDAARKQGGA